MGDPTHDVVATNKPGETREEFDRRVDALVREATERDGVKPFVLTVFV